TAGVSLSRIKRPLARGLRAFRAWARLGADGAPRARAHSLGSRWTVRPADGPRGARLSVSQRRRAHLFDLPSGTRRSRRGDGAREGTRLARAAPPPAERTGERRSRGASAGDGAPRRAAVRRQRPARELIPRRTGR